MAHGLAVENTKWYVKSKLTHEAVSGPYPNAEQADAAAIKVTSRFGDRFGDLYVTSVNIVTRTVIRRVLVQEVVNGKRQPARKRQ